MIHSRGRPLQIISTFSRGRPLPTPALHRQAYLPHPAQDFKRPTATTVLAEEAPAEHRQEDPQGTRGIMAAPPETDGQDTALPVDPGGLPMDLPEDPVDPEEAGGLPEAHHHSRLELDVGRENCRDLDENPTACTASACPQCMDLEPGSSPYVTKSLA